MKWLLRSLGLLFGATVLLVTLALFLLATFDPNTYREQIEQQISEKMGREVLLEGSVRLQLFPDVAVQLESLTIRNPPDFAEPIFLHADSVGVAVAVLPLLRREITVRGIEVDGATLYLRRTEDGNTNWQDLEERFAKNTAPIPLAQSGAPLPVDTTAPEPAPAIEWEALSIQELDLRHLVIDWDDRQSGVHARMDADHLSLRNFRAGVDAPLRLMGGIVLTRDGAAPESLRVESSSRIHLDFRQQRLALRSLQATLQLAPNALEKTLDLRLESEMMIDFSLDRLRLETLRLQWAGMEITGNLTVDDFRDPAPRLRGALRSNDFDPRALFLALGLNPPETADPNALRSLVLDADLSGNVSTLELDPLLLQLDSETLRGALTLDFSGIRPEIRWNLTGNQLHLDRYLPPRIEAASVPEPVEPPPVGVPPPGAEDIPVVLPVHWMNALDMQGTLELQRIELLGLQLQNVRLHLHGQNGEWRIDPLSGTGYDGQIEARLHADARHSPVQFRGQVRLEQLQIAPVLEGLLQREPLLEGLGNLTLQVESRGETLHALTANLNGFGELNLQNGLVKGINIARIIRQAEARLRGEAIESDGEPNQTDFAALQGSFTIQNGRVQNDDLNVSSPLLRMAGRGHADLVATRMDYTVDTTIVATLEGQGGRSLEQLRGLRLPIRITGSFDEPRFSLQLEEILRERLEERARREVERLQERALERLLNR